MENKIGKRNNWEMKTLSRLIGLLFFLAGHFLIAAETPNDPKNVWIFAGQSNMDNPGYYEHYANKFQEILRDSLQLEVRTVKVARGSTGILEGDAWEVEKGDMWVTLMDTIKTIGAEKIKGIIWYQGEQNASDEQNYFNPLAYKFTMIKFINKIRSTIGDTALPFIQTQLSNYTDSTAGIHNRNFYTWTMIREVQREVSEEVNGVATVTTFDILHPDNSVHLCKDNFSNCDFLGRRYALTALDLAYNKKQNLGPRLKDISVLNKEGDSILIQFKSVSHSIILAPQESLAVSNFQGYVDTANYNHDHLSSNADSGNWSLPISRIEKYSDSAIILVLSKPLKSDGAIGFAAGRNPYSGIRDSSGEPLQPFPFVVVKNELSDEIKARSNLNQKGKDTFYLVNDMYRYILIKNVWDADIGYLINGVKIFPRIKHKNMSN